MPPAPDVMAALFMEYKRKAAPGMSFTDYLASIGFVDPSVTTNGMDDRLLARPTAAGGVELLAIPQQKVAGELRVMVLLVEFEDRRGVREPQHYQDLLFSRGEYPTGSMRDFYAEASGGKVDVVGSVHGWLRMPQRYSYYVNGESGTGPGSYPRNCQRLAEDAVQAARWQGVSFPADLDKLGQGSVTALFIVHAGRGAEAMPSVAQQNAEIWSHKWAMQQAVEVAPQLAATTYLVVPQDCRVGVCAHELGHLAFQWQDFYDPNYDQDGQYWDGSGTWDLMAGGSHNNGGSSPAHPAVLHKVQHDWVQVQTVRASARVQVKPLSAPGGRAVRVESPAYARDQFLLLENRRREGFDRHLAGEGLLVWKIDLSREMEAPARPGMQLVQADGFDELATGHDRNAGDDGDPFPGSSAQTELGDTGVTSTSFPGGPRSRVKLSNIRMDSSGTITLDVQIGATAAKKKPDAKAAPAKQPALKTKRKPRIPVVTDERLTLAGMLGKPAAKAKAKAKKKAAKTGKTLPMRP
jgi:immune inhibitor A